MKKLLLLFMFTPLMLTLSCNSTDDENDPINCTQEFVDGLRVTVLNQPNGQPILENVTVTATDGTYQETLLLADHMQNFFAGAGERTGTYTVKVTKAGYQTYTSQPIVVTRDVCHVLTQSLTVNLVPN